MWWVHSAASDFVPFLHIPLLFQMTVYLSSRLLITCLIPERQSEVTQSCPTLCGPMDCSLPDSSIHGFFWARILEWVAISFSRRSSRLRHWTQISCIVGRCFTIWATREDISSLSWLSFLHSRVNPLSFVLDTFSQWIIQEQVCSPKVSPIKEKEMHQTVRQGTLYSSLLQQGRGIGLDSTEIEGKGFLSTGVS